MFDDQTFLIKTGTWKYPCNTHLRVQKVASNILVQFKRGYMEICIFFFAATIFKSFSCIVSFLVSLLILQLYYIILVSIFILYYTSFYIVIISE